MKKQSGSGGMGITKHGKSGYPTKSPRYRHLKQIEANKSDIKAKPSTCKHESLEDLFKND